MSDPYKRVSPGQRFRSLPAAAYNAMLDAAEAERRRTIETGAEQSGWRPNASVVRLKNDTEANLLRGSILGLNGPILLPGVSVDAFLREVTFRGVEPSSDHENRFAVLLEPIKAGGVGRACIAGVCPVRIDVSSDDHLYAIADTGVTTSLISADSGAARILWREDEGGYGGGYGDQWALIAFGTICSGAYE